MSIRARWPFFPYLSYFNTVLLKRPTWCLSDVITSHFNLVWWSWRRPSVHRHSMTTYVRAPPRVSSHIHYINSDLRHHFLICGYGIFTSLRHAMSYSQTMSAYDLCIFFFFFCLHAVETFFEPFSFVSTLYPFLSPSVSTLDLILSLLYPCWNQFVLGLA